MSFRDLRSKANLTPVTSGPPEARGSGPPGPLSEPRRGSRAGAPSRASAARGRSWPAAPQAERPSPVS